jgi:hypothetical protein
MLRIAPKTCRWRWERSRVSLTKIEERRRNPSARVHNRSPLRYRDKGETRARERERQRASDGEQQRTQDGWVVCSRSWSRSKSRSQSRSLSRFIVHAHIRVPSVHPSIRPSISTLLENDEKLDGRYLVLTIIGRVTSFVMQASFNKYVPGDHDTLMLSK